MCGPDAQCDVEIERCVCRAGLLPCGSGCCPLSVTREIELAPTGTRPEIASHADAVYIAYRVGSASVWLARLDRMSGGLTYTAVADGSGEADDFDLVVDPDGTQHVAIHRPGAGRSGLFSHFRRTGSSGRFAEANILPGGPATFAYGAAVSLARTASGDLLAMTSRRVGDGQMGLLLSRYDAAAGTWSFVSSLVEASSYSRSELFASGAGFFSLLRRNVTGDHLAFEHDAVGDVTRTVNAGGATGAATLSDSGALYSLIGRRLRLSDGTLSETLPPSGAWNDLDMAVDADGNLAFAYHDATLNEVVLKIRMPLGGYATRSWPELRFAPGAGGRAQLVLDLERLSGGDLALVIGEARGTAPLTYLEITR